MSEVTSGISEIDSKYLSLIEQGIEFSLFTVTCKVKIDWEGDVKVSATSGAATFSGSARLLAPLEVRTQLSLRIGIDGNYVLKFTLFDPWSLVLRTVQPAVSRTTWQTLEKLVKPYLMVYRESIVIIASRGGEDAKYGEYVAGANFFAQIKANEVEPLRMLDQTFRSLALGGCPLILHTACIADPTLTFLIEGKLVLKKQLGTSAVVINNLDLRVDASSQDLASCVAVTFDLNIAKQKLSFIGSLAMSTEGSITIAGSIDHETGAWKDPFGLKGLTITGFGVQLSETATPPYFGIGARGGLHVGDGMFGGEMAILFDPASPENSILYINSKEGMDLQRLLRGLVDPQHVPADLLEVALKNLMIYVAPYGGFVANKEYSPGYHLAGDIDLWGWKAHLDGMLEFASGGYLHGTMDPIRMPSSPALVEIAGVSSNRPTVKLDFNAAARGLRMSGKLALAGAGSQAIDVRVDNHGFSLYLEKDRMGLYGDATLKYSDGVFSTDVNTGFDFMFIVGGYSFLGVAAPGTGYPVHIQMKAAFHVDANTTRILNRISFSFDAFGEHTTLAPIEWSLPISRLDDLSRICTEKLSAAINDYFANKLRSGGQTVFAWVQANWTTVARDVAGICRYCNVSCSVATAGLQQVYRQAPPQVAQALDNVQYPSKDIAQSLQTVYGMSTTDVLKTLKAAGLTANEIASACKGAFGWSATQTARFMKDTLDYGDDSVANALKAANYAKDDVKEAMADVFGWAESAWNSFAGTVSGWF